MKKLAIFSVIVLCSFVFLSSANADMIMYDMKGTITKGSSLLGISAGDSWEAIFTIDTTAPDVYSGPNSDIFAWYPMTSQTLDFTAGSSFIRHYTGVQIGVWNNFSDPTTGTTDNWILASPYPSGNSSDFLAVYIVDSTAKVFDSNALPAYIQLSDFDFTNMNFAVSGSGFELFGDVKSISEIAVPEPATILLLGSGLIGLVYGRKRFLKK